MTRLTIIFISLIATVLILAGQSSATIGPETIVGMWLLDDGSGKTVKDSSENGFDGEIVGAVEWTKEKKFGGNGLFFPGDASSYVTIPHDDSMNLVTMTALAWVKMDKEQTDGNAPIYKADGSNRNYALRLHCCPIPSTNTFYLEFSNPPGSWHNTYNGKEKTILTDGKWHHIAGTYDKKVIRAYVDGVLEGAETAWEGTPDTNKAPIQLGARSLKGILDDVGIFNIALSQDDINTIMKKGLAGITAVSPADKLATTWGQIKSYQ